MRKRGSSYLPFTRKRRQQNVIIPKKKKPAENIDGFVSGLKPGIARLFSFFDTVRRNQLIAFISTLKNSVSPEESSTPSLSVTA